MLLGHIREQILEVQVAFNKNSGKREYGEGGTARGDAGPEGLLQDRLAAFGRRAAPAPLLASTPPGETT